MRFAYAVYPFLGYAIPDLFKTDESYAEFEKALEILKENGFPGVQVSFHFSDANRLARIRKIVDKSGLKIAAIGTGHVSVFEGASFTDPDPKKRARAVEIVKGILQFAAVDDSRICIGFIRGSNQNFIPDRGKGGDNLDSARNYLRECMVECDAAAHDAGVKLGIEPVNRYDTLFLNTADEVASFIQDSNLTSTGVLLDTFQMSMEENSILGTIARHRSRIVHFHIEDSNRWVPTYGNLKIEDSLNLLKALDYDGWVTTEALPKPSRDEALRTTVRFLQAYRFM